MVPNVVPTELTARLFCIYGQFTVFTYAFHACYLLLTTLYTLHTHTDPNPNPSPSPNPTLTLTPTLVPYTYPAQAALGGRLWLTSATRRTRVPSCRGVQASCSELKARAKPKLQGELEQARST